MCLAFLLILISGNIFILSMTFSLIFIGGNSFVFLCTFLFMIIAALFFVGGVASFFWAVGATLAGPSSVADYLQLFAALAWCIANFATAWSMHRRPDAITLKNAKLSRV